MIDLFCLASGPSLTEEDCKLVKESGARVLAVNNSWELVPWCDYLYAGDIKWWEGYANKVPSTIQKWTSAKKAAAKFGLNYHPATGAFNSGMRALIWAMENGYKRIFLLGYDCSLKNGVHWHGSHDAKKGLNNPDKGRVVAWQEHFMKVFIKARKLGVEIINCSRYTELTCFKYSELEFVLGLKIVVKEEEEKLTPKTGVISKDVKFEEPGLEPQFYRDAKKVINPLKKKK